MTQEKQEKQEKQERFLFSCVSDADLYQYHRDRSGIDKSRMRDESTIGALHAIAMDVKPQTVCLFYTTEFKTLLDQVKHMLRHVLKDIVEGPVTIHEVEYTKDNPADYNGFLKQFSELLATRRNSHQKERIYVNVSSGTPQMQASLFYLACLPESTYEAVQAPKRNTRDNKREPQLYISGSEIGAIAEETSGFYEANVKHITNVVWLRDQQLKRIESHLSNGDYAGALHSARNQGLFGDRTRHALQGAIDRLAFRDDAWNHFEKAGLSLHLNCDAAEGDATLLKKALEGYLGMRLYFDRTDYSSFYTRLSPVCVSLALLTLKQVFGFDLVGDGIVVDNNGWTWTNRVAPPNPRSPWTGTGQSPPNGGYTYLQGLLAAMEVLCSYRSGELKDAEKAKEMLTMFKWIRNNQEKSLRNRFAHELAPVTLDDILKAARKDFGIDFKVKDDLLSYWDTIARACASACGVAFEPSTVYKRMNEAILALAERDKGTDAAIAAAPPVESA